MGANASEMKRTLEMTMVGNRIVKRRCGEPGNEPLPYLDDNITISYVPRRIRVEDPPDYQGILPPAIKPAATDDIYGASISDKGEEPDVPSSPSVVEIVDDDANERNSPEIITISDDDDEISSDRQDSNTANSGPVRKKCGWGSLCQRWGKEHTAEYCHPGDADYKPA